MSNNYDELLIIKIKLLDKFRSNCEKQIYILNNNLIKKLSDVLKNQDDIIMELKSIDKKIDSYSLQNNSYKKDIEERLKDIKELQDIIKEKVNNERQDLRRRFKQINIGKKAIYGGYIKAEPMNSGYFIDKKIGK